MAVSGARISIRATLKNFKGSHEMVKNLIAIGFLSFIGTNTVASDLSIKPVEDYVGALQNAATEECTKKIRAKVGNDSATTGDGDSFTPYYYERRWRLNGLATARKKTYQYICMVDASSFDKNKKVAVIHLDIH